MYHNPATSVYFLFYAGRLTYDRAADWFRYSDFEEPSKVRPPSPSPLQSKKVRSHGKMFETCNWLTFERFQNFASLAGHP